MNLKQWREHEGLTQAAAAARCGVSKRTWESWEHRRHIPRGELLQKVIDASDGLVTLADILKKNTAA